MYNFTRSNSCYISDICRHFQTRIFEHNRTDKNPSIYKPAHENEDCFNSLTFDFFSFLHTAQTEYHLTIKEVCISAGRNLA